MEKHKINRISVFVINFYVKRRFAFFGLMQHLQNFYLHIKNIKVHQSVKGEI